MGPGRMVALIVILTAACGTPRLRAPETMWAHVAAGGAGTQFSATRWSRHEPYRYPFPLPCVGQDGEILLFATRTSSPGGLFGSRSCVFEYEAGDGVAYTPTGRVGDPARRYGREWREYRLLGGPHESARAAEAITGLPGAGR